MDRSAKIHFFSVCLRFDMQAKYKAYGLYILEVPLGSLYTIVRAFLDRPSATTQDPGKCN